MNHLTVASILKRQIQIGNTNIPVVFIAATVCLFAIVMGFNAIYLKRYYKLMSYFKKFYPEIYERISIKPDFGEIYFTNKNRAKPLIEFAKHHEPLNDSKAEKMLADFIEFERQTTWLGSAIMIIAFVCLFVLGVVFTPY